VSGVRVLGEIEVVDGGRTIAVGSSKQRLLLALLAAADGPLSPDRLIEGLWGEEPPPTARATLTGYVSRLRGAVGADAIEGGPLGYRLRGDEIDAHRFEATVEHGLAGANQNELVDALDLWSGDPFAEFADHPFLIPVSDRLRELRASARVRLAALYLDAGDTARPISMLEAVVQEDPVREDAWVLLVRSLLAGGRPADAVRAAYRCRRQLADMGLEPADDLVALEAQAFGQRTTPTSSAAADIDTGPVRYVRDGDIHLGYQTAGGGVVDLVLSSYGSVSIDAIWDDHHFAGFVRRLAATCRVVLYDTRGIGLSDPIDPNAPPSILAQSDDLMAVVDAAKATRPVLVGVGDGGPTVITAAHRHARRVAGLVLVNTFARLSRTDDYPIGIPADVLAANIATTTDHASERDTSHVLRTTRRAWRATPSSAAGGSGPAVVAPVRQRPRRCGRCGTGPTCDRCCPS
jgi:DNA-binding SARP family transcriptional activator/pimeloyl-ACP methyl ester carboxylesterase